MERKMIVNYKRLKLPIKGIFKLYQYMMVKIKTIKIYVL